MEYRIDAAVHLESINVRSRNTIALLALAARFRKHLRQIANGCQESD
jgi:hypothetical protein